MPIRTISQMLTIYNSLTRQKEKFEPVEPGKVRMYVCGITAYDYCHIGHARMILVFDMVVRYLRFRGYEVTYIRNITDIDDKIIERSKENGEAFDELTERFIRAMNEDFTALNVALPDAEPRATAHIDQIITMIAELMHNGYAYQAENGDVFYDVSAFKEYGKLSGKNIEKLRAGIRVDVQEVKDDPVDFVLWKAQKPGEPGWDSPWGRGRPGWHIECSAMSTHCLGNDFDIHGGGQDLQFPHHENEIAQSIGAGSETFVNTWMHNGFVRVDDEKMSKSLGNFFTIREVMEQYQPEVIRFFILSSHYRSPLNYSGGHLDEAKAGLTRLYTAIRDVDPRRGDVVVEYKDRFEQVMDDDFNTREAITILHEIAGELNKLTDSADERALNLARTLSELGGVLGIMQLTADEFWRGNKANTGITPEQIGRLIDERAKAKQNKNYAAADRIRDGLTEKGVLLEDRADGTTWRMK